MTEGADFVKIKKLIAVVVSLCILIVLAASPVLGDELPEGFNSWEEYYDYLIFGDAANNKTPPIHEMKKVAENDRIVMYYYDKGADVYLEDKASGKIFGSAIEEGYIKTEGMAPNATSNLLTVSYADDKDNLVEADLTNESTDDFSVTTDYIENGVNLSVNMENTQISFDVEITLLNDGMRVNIPYSSIKEGKKHKLVSIKMMPIFGAAKPGEDGYIFYPDGSGALMYIDNYRKNQPAFYNYPIYCDDSADFDAFADNENQDIKNFMLPIFGIKHTSGSVFAEITSGEENARLHIGVDALYQSYFELVYRTYNKVVYEFASKTSGEVNKVGKKPMKGDRTVVYHILESDKNTYSDMAVLYRNQLIERGELTKKESSSEIPLSVEFFMGISKSGIIGDSIQTLTTFEDAKAIVEDLHKSGITNLDVLLKGWCDGGFDTLPTSNKAENKLGSQSKLEELYKSVKSKNGSLYLLADLINGNSKTGKFNTDKYAIRDGLDTVITDSENKTLYWLNPKNYMPSSLSKLLKAQKDSGMICLDNAGSWLLSDVGESHETSRAEIVGAIQKAMKTAKDSQGDVAVVDGNNYVWKYANRIYDLPDNDSQYYQTDLTVPFYQMVVHGFKDYSSLAANLSFDYTYQKLRFVETGSIPHFVLTQNSPNLLKGTSYDDIFSSEYSEWKKIILSIHSEMEEKLSSIWGLTMDRHEYLNKDLVRITYSDGSMVYINYSDEEISVSDITVPAMDYCLVGGHKE